MNKANYKNSITNFSNSMLKHFGVKPFHNTIPEIDKLLEGKKKVVIFLFDGMGKTVLEKHLKDDSFFRNHVVHEMTSTLPPTTVASTTSFLSGKYPIETGWLGWTIYFKELGRAINVFKNEDDITGEHLDGDIMNDKCPYRDIARLINDENNKLVANINMGYPVNKYDKRMRHLRRFVKTAFEPSHRKEESFTYAYWVTPDALMHRCGVNSLRVHLNILKIQRLVKKYAEKNKDVAVFVIADHGMKDVKFVDMNEHKDLTSLLDQPMSLEKRCINFKVKAGKKEEFKELFNKYYGDHYELITVDEALKQRIFGDAEPSMESIFFLGDFIAVATDEISLEMRKKHKRVHFKAHHAGTTLDELMISVIGINV